MRTMAMVGEYRCKNPWLEATNDQLDSVKALKETWKQLGSNVDNGPIFLFSFASF